MSGRTRLRLAAGALLAVHLALAAAGFLAPYPYEEQQREYPHAPPTRVHWLDANGRFRGPFVYGIHAEPDGTYREDRSRSYPLRFDLPRRLFRVDRPGVVFLLGADAFGRDVYSRVLYGGRISLLTGLGATLAALLLGLAIGAAAGFYGGWLDRLLMRGGELTMALPRLYVLLAVRSVLPLHLSAVVAVSLMVGIIGCFGWMRPARLVRAVALEARERGFLAAARGLGASNMYLIRRHLLPLTLPVLVTQATLLIPQYVLAEVALSFLGLGIGEPLPSWGNMLAQARQYHAIVEHWWLLAPGLALIPVLMSYTFLADEWLERRKA